MATHLRDSNPADLRGDARRELQRIDRALSIGPSDAQLLINRAQCLLALGRRTEACDALAAAQRVASANPLLLDAIGSSFSHADDQSRAFTAFDKAVKLAPDNAHFIFNRATVQRFLGRFSEAEADYDKAIALKPDDYEAYKNRSELRTQTAAVNHIAQLEALVARGLPEWRGYVQVQYALAKEYEDIGDYEKSFAHLQRGAQRRREHMRYDVAADVSTVDWIIDAYPGGSPGTTGPPAAASAASDTPIFIVGLPRSGTTLVDRILDSHSGVRSAGELNDFALSIVDAVRRRSGGAPMTRRELVARSAALDFAALGHEYLGRVRFALSPGVRFTDKMPLNYLYCALIGRALPNAKIVHLTRHPMAACYSMYKTLFKDGYPFSYDLHEIGNYYIAYRRLMDHWHGTLPGAILSVRYEDLVADQLGETRRLLQFCNLEWEENCVRFHENPSSTTTASATQVRRRIYGSSVDQWRRYAPQLAVLRAQLNAAGISTE